MPAEPLSPNDLQELVKRDPVTALEQQMFTMSVHQLSQCVYAYKGITIKEATLTPLQIHKLAFDYPTMVIQWIPDKLNSEDFQRCIKQANWSCIRYAGHLLNDEQINYCFQKNKEAMIIYLPHKIPKKVFIKFIENNPKQTIQMLHHSRGLKLAQELFKLKQSGESVPEIVHYFVLKILSKFI